MSSGFIVLLTIAVLGAYVRAETKECPPNSFSQLCGSVCEQTCKNPVEIACRVDPRTCTTDCKCVRGFVKNTETNECVKLEDCPGRGTTVASTGEATAA